MDITSWYDGVREELEVLVQDKGQLKARDGAPFWNSVPLLGLSCGVRNPFICICYEPNCELYPAVYTMEKLDPP